MFDTIIVGGGPAGLNAALMLGRCRRRVLLCDEDRPRNAVSRGINGFLSRDGIAPRELRRISRDELGRYPTVEVLPATVIDALHEGDHFTVRFGDDRLRSARTLLLACGQQVELPDLPGLPEIYGKSAFDCPYCDGFEERDQPIAVLGRGRAGLAFARELRGWSTDLIWLTGGPSGLGDEDRALLAADGIGLCEQPIERLEVRGDALHSIRFSDGGALARRALFFLPKARHATPIARRLGCELTGHGKIKSNDYGQTGIDGLFVAGDASRHVQFAIVAAAEGAMAAFAINTHLLKQDQSQALRTIAVPQRS